jgi:hypothetical protein
MNRKSRQGLTRLEVATFGLLEGSMLTLGAIVAPQLFRRIPSRDKAGRIFGQILKTWFWLGLACLLVLFATGISSLTRQKNQGRVILGGRVAVVAGMLGQIAAFRGVLARMDKIRAGLTAPIETYAADYGPRQEFNRLHQRSTGLMKNLMGLGVVWLGLSLALVARTAKKNS